MTKKILLLAYLVSISSLLSAQNTTIVIKEHTYAASDDDSKNDAREKALEVVKFLVAEETATYVFREATLNTLEHEDNFAQRYSEVLKTVSAGTFKTRILEETWNGSEFYIKAEIELDKDELARNLRKVIEEQNRNAPVMASAQDPVASTVALSGYEGLPNRWFEEGKNAFEARQYKTASKLFSKVIRRNKKMERRHNEGFAQIAEVYYLNAYADYMVIIKGNAPKIAKKLMLKKSIKDVQTALSVNPKKEEYLWLMASCYKVLEKHKEAKDVWFRLAKLYPSNCDHLYELAVSYNQLGQSQCAADLFSMAINRENQRKCSFYTYENSPWQVKEGVSLYRKGKVSNSCPEIGALRQPVD